MSAFADSQLVEAESRGILRPYLEEKSNGKLVMTTKGRLARWLQESVGDCIMEINEECVAVELKAERKHTGNLFLEIWSNRNLDNRKNYDYAGQNVGWMLKCRADCLLYHFLQEDLLYCVDVFRLKQWLFGANDVGGALYTGRFTPKKTRSAQLNDTWGVCVSVDLLQTELKRGFKKTHVKQRELEISA